jgi:cytochrome c oxidase assembly protein subunit 15
MTFLAAALALLVIAAGAYTRLTHAGLGCPDWPGCYHHLLAPVSLSSVYEAQLIFPHAPVNIGKAWTEMGHRYLAMLLGIMVMVLALTAYLSRKPRPQGLLVPSLLLALVVLQSLFGMWTVTMKLTPLVVMGHLLGGFTLCGLLWWQYLSGRVATPAGLGQSSVSLRPWTLFGLMLLIVQIALGGWTSANYAALVCQYFPFCSSRTLWPTTDFGAAFNLWLGAGFKPMTQAALISIHLAHRLGALMVYVYFTLLSVVCLMAPGLRRLRGLAALILLLLNAQVALGILNVVWRLPLGLALAHNIVAALLLLSVLALIYHLYDKRIDR